MLTKAEVSAILDRMSGLQQLIVQLLYGSGLRLTEGLQLRVKDLDFAQHQMIIRDAKGNESRVTMLPTKVFEPLKMQLQRTKRLHQQDLERGYGSVYLPYALERKYRNAEREWIWRCILPSISISTEPRSGIVSSTSGFLWGWAAPPTKNRRFEGVARRATPSKRRLSNSRKFKGVLRGR